MRGTSTDLDDTRTFGWMLVATQFLSLAVIALEALRPARPRIARRIGVLCVLGGLAAVAAGSERLGRRLSPHPEPPTEAILRTDGAYRIVRHPIYAGLLLIGGGATMAAGTPRALAAMGGLAMALHTKAAIEERLLTERFPEYEAYARRTPRLVPRIPSE